MQFSEDILKLAVDEVILKQGDDPVIKEALRQLDEVVKKTGISMYELLSYVVKKQMLIEDEWDQLLHDRGL